VHKNPVRAVQKKKKNRRLCFCKRERLRKKRGKREEGARCESNRDGNRPRRVGLTGEIFFHFGQLRTAAELRKKGEEKCDVPSQWKTETKRRHKKAEKTAKATTFRRAQVGIRDRRKDERKEGT